MNAETPRPAWLQPVAAVSGFLGVALGAFGAHGLQPLLEERGTLAVWNTAVQYHFVHTLALLALAFAWSGVRCRFPRAVAVSWIVGVLIFSGSLYLLATVAPRWFGAITPIGGLLFLLGWFLLLFPPRADRS
jgi:uncharacterized membrane protein YgdD (TMEM256/DUF423 family)